MTRGQHSLNISAIIRVIAVRERLDRFLGGIFESSVSVVVCLDDVRVVWVMTIPGQIRV
jgi:hypothetical protein